MMDTARTPEQAQPAAAPGSTPISPPNVHQRMLLTWAVIWPEVMAMSWLTAPWTTTWSMPLKTLLITGVVVPMAVYVFVPALFKLRVVVLSAHRRSRVRRAAESAAD